MSEQEILNAVQDIFRDNFDDDTLEITRSTCADDIEDWDSLEQINLLTAIEKKFNIKFKLAGRWPRRAGGREPCHNPKYFGQPYSSLPHRLRAEPPPRGGQENTQGGILPPFFEQRRSLP